MLVTRRNFERALAGFANVRRLILDTETTGLSPWLGDRVCGISLATPALDHICYFPIRHRDGENLTRRDYNRLLHLVCKLDVILTGWNIKFDLGMLFQDGLPLPTEAEDVMLAAHHLNENDRPFELKRWAKKHIDPDADAEEGALLDLIRARCKERKLKVKKKELKGHISILRPEEVEPYACDDVYYTEQLRRVMVPALKRWETLALWRDSNRAMLEVAKMEQRGLLLDVPRIQANITEADEQAAIARTALTAKAGFEINTNSPQQICKWLNISSSAKEILDELDTPEAEALLSYRAWTKVTSTYYRPFLQEMDDDGVFHPSLKLHGTVTGRMSAQRVHQIPRERPEYKVKECIVARPGFVLISADYNQAELRMGVSVAREENMAKLFLSARKVDIHQLVANALGFPDNRDLAKTINFMILYGGGVDKLARKAKIPYDDAFAYLEHYHREYWHFRHTSRWWANRAKYQGYIRLWNGRVRHFNHPLANPKDAFNSKVQGGVSVMLQEAMLSLGRILPAYNTHMLLQVHDQIIFEAPERVVPDVAPIIVREMERFDHFLIPPIADVKVGPRWGDLHDYELPKAA